MRRTGIYGTKNEQLMNTFKNWLRMNHLFNKKIVIYGIAQDNPSCTRPEDCRYDVGIPVDTFEDFYKTDIQFGNISAGHYLLLTLPHTKEAMDKAWQSVEHHIINYNCTIDYSRPILERYSFEMIDQHQCEICIPVNK